MSEIDKIREVKQLYIDVFDNDNGKKILEELGKRCFIHRPTFNKDGMTMAFNEGQRSIILHIQNMMKIDIDATKKLIEAQNKGKDTDNVE